ncbi:MAG TPA: TIGR03435 family protein [Candidatus Sulfopaludibacter sp.]|jgi:uncharacterized protein (TIGR03435 family)|nr:TIGR03435 family protein [Candidatus Sulfopaludibacter sp.]
MRLALLLLLCLPVASAQPVFEAASVKPSHSVDLNSTFNTRQDNVETKNVTLRDILVAAFEIKDYQLSGPDWLKSERFDIVAKAPLGTGDDEKLMPLLKSLLVQRFKLESHLEKRDLPCFALLVAKGGFKLKPVEAGPSGMGSTSNEGGGELKADKVRMEAVAEWLSREVQRPVLDMTNLKGAYDFTLRYSKESAKGITDTQAHPVVSFAIQEQLGLRLEKRTAPVSIVVIDHIEKVPLEN